jgi:hypothetical protein
MAFVEQQAGVEDVDITIPPENKMDDLLKVREE